MTSIKVSNNIYYGAEGKESLIDLEIPQDFNGQIIIFVHGFMGFKDWGAWYLVQKFFTDKRYGFCKFNTTHNGGTIKDGIDFSDPSSFSRNTYSKEIADVNAVVKWIDQKVDIWSGHFIGHSKGGAVALISGQHIPVIRSISTWASIASIEERFPIGRALEEWKSNGFRTIKNGRTLQDLPQAIGLWEDFQKYKSNYDLKKICEACQKPIFIAHGEKDTSVSIDDGIKLSKWSNTTLNIIQNADHVFQSKQPWHLPKMPANLNELCRLTEIFISKTYN